MGNLTPGVALIYERDDGIIYAREVGADPSTRRVIGYEHAHEYDPVRRSKISWHDVLESSKTNPALADAVDRVVMLYELSRPND